MNNITPEQRLRRIAEIINKGIYLYALKEGWFVQSAKENEQKQLEGIAPEEHEILNLCKANGRITNKDVQDLLGVPRNTATAKLKDMAKKGLLVRAGNHRHTHYLPPNLP